MYPSADPDVSGLGSGGAVSRKLSVKVVLGMGLMSSALGAEKRETSTIPVQQMRSADTWEEEKEGVRRRRRRRRRHHGL